MGKSKTVQPLLLFFEDDLIVDLEKELSWVAEKEYVSGVIFYDDSFRKVNFNKKQQPGAWKLIFDGSEWKGSEKCVYLVVYFVCIYLLSLKITDEIDIVISNIFIKDYKEKKWKATEKTIKKVFWLIFQNETIFF